MQRNARSFHVRPESVAVLRCPKDGTCVFHALALGMGDGSSGHDLRRDLAKLVADKPKMKIQGVKLESWIHHETGLSAKEYAKEIRDGKWGGGIEISLFTKLKHKNVNVFEFDSEGYTRIAEFKGPPAAFTQPPVDLLYSERGTEGKEHYDGLSIPEGAGTWVARSAIDDSDLRCFDCVRTGSDITESSRVEADGRACAQCGKRPMGLWKAVDPAPAHTPIPSLPLEKEPSALKAPPAALPPARSPASDGKLADVLPSDGSLADGLLADGSLTDSSPADGQTFSDASVGLLGDDTPADDLPTDGRRAAAAPAYSLADVRRATPQRSVAAVARTRRKAAAALVEVKSPTVMFVSQDSEVGVTKSNAAPAKALTRNNSVFWGLLTIPWFVLALLTLLYCSSEDLSLTMRQRHTNESMPSRTMLLNHAKTWNAIVFPIVKIRQAHDRTDVVSKTTFDVPRCSGCVLPLPFDHNRSTLQVSRRACHVDCHLQAGQGWIRQTRLHINIVDNDSTAVLPFNVGDQSSNKIVLITSLQQEIPGKWVRFKACHVKFTYRDGKDFANRCSRHLSYDPFSEYELHRRWRAMWVSAGMLFYLNHTKQCAATVWGAQVSCGSSTSKEVSQDSCSSVLIAAALVCMMLIIVFAVGTALHLTFIASVSLLVGVGVGCIAGMKGWRTVFAIAFGIVAALLTVNAQGSDNYGFVQFVGLFALKIFTLISLLHFAMEPSALKEPPAALPAARSPASDGKLADVLPSDGSLGDGLLADGSLTDSSPADGQTFSAASVGLLADDTPADDLPTDGRRAAAAPAYSLADVRRATPQRSVAAVARTRRKAAAALVEVRYSAVLICGWLYSVGVANAASQLSDSEAQQRQVDVAILTFIAGASLTLLGLVLAYYKKDPARAVRQVRACVVCVCWRCRRQKILPVIVDEHAPSGLGVAASHDEVDSLHEPSLGRPSNFAPRQRTRAQQQQREMITKGVAPKTVPLEWIAFFVDGKVPVKAVIDCVITRMVNQGAIQSSMTIKLRRQSMQGDQCEYEVTFSQNRVQIRSVSANNTVSRKSEISKFKLNDMKKINARVTIDARLKSIAVETTEGSMTYEDDGILYGNFIIGARTWSHFLDLDDLHVDISSGSVDEQWNWTFQRDEAAIKWWEGALKKKKKLRGLRKLVLGHLLFLYATCCTILPKVVGRVATCRRGMYWENHIPFAILLFLTKVAELIFFAADQSVEGTVDLLKFVLLFTPSFLGYADGYQDSVAFEIVRACAEDEGNDFVDLSWTLFYSMSITYYGGVVIIQWVVFAWFAIRRDDSGAVLAKLLHMDVLAYCSELRKEDLWMWVAVNLARFLFEDIPQASQQTVFVVAVTGNSFMILSIVFSVCCSLKAVYAAYQRRAEAAGQKLKEKQEYKAAEEDAQKKAAKEEEAVIKKFEEKDWLQNGGTELRMAYYNGDDVNDILKDAAPHLRNLRKIVLADTKVTDAGVKDAAPHLQHLQFLDLAGTQVTDSGLKEVAVHCSNLQRIDLWGTKVTDAGLKEIAAHCKQLEMIDLRDTKVTDVGVKEAAPHLTNLKVLGLSATQVTDTGLKEIRRLLPNCTVDE